MKYIEKGDAPQYFIDEVKELQTKLEKLNSKKEKSDVWNNDFKGRRKLKEYMLENEQNWLCGYCEAKVTLDNSHIEHIKAKFIDYDNLTFDYLNLLVSCEGICFSDNNEKLTCGHKKDTKGYKVNYALFLNPAKVKNIRKYFKYTDNFNIGATQLSPQRAIETIRVLNLGEQNNQLQEARKNALKTFKKSVRQINIKTKKPLKEIIIFLLEKENLAFISFLRYKFKMDK